MKNSTKIFETQNADFATFLIMEGIALSGYRRKHENSNIVILQFEDEKQNCLDLERVFIRSDFKKYRDLNKWLLGKLYDFLRETPTPDSSSK